MTTVNWRSIHRVVFRTVLVIWSLGMAFVAAFFVLTGQFWVQWGKQPVRERLIIAADNPLQFFSTVAVIRKAPCVEKRAA
jgi:hypothetical protein